MTPTERAMALADPVRKVLGEIQDILQAPAAFDPLQSTRTFTIAGTEYVALAIMPLLMRQLQVEAPNVRLAFVAPNHETMAQQMEAGVLDLAIVNQALVPAQLKSLRFVADEFCVIGRKDHPSLKKRLSLETFCRLPHVMVSPRTGSFSAQTDEALKKLKLARFVRLSVPYFTLAAEAVAYSDMIAVYPRRLTALLDKRVQVLPAPLDLPSFSLKACWHERAQHDSAHQWLRKMILACLQ
jgi:DNA-binding transcriptional LysR family regulator